MQAAGAEISLRYDHPMAVVGQLCTPLLVSTTEGRSFICRVFLRGDGVW